MSRLPRPSEFSLRTTDQLIAFWRVHRGFDADISGLAEFCGVSRDTVYRWLNHRAYPRQEKARRIEMWLRQKNPR